LPHHVAEPSGPALVRAELPQLSRADLPPALQEELAAWPEIAGIANAARQISASLIAASRRDADEISGLRELGDDEVTRVPSGLDDDMTSPRDLPFGAGPLASALFAPVPAHNRAAVLQRFGRRTVAIGTR